MKLHKVLIALFVSVALLIGGAVMPTGVLAQDSDDIVIQECRVEAWWNAGEDTVVIDGEEVQIRWDEGRVQAVSRGPGNPLSDVSFQGIFPYQADINWRISITASDTKCRDGQQNYVYAEMKKSSGGNDSGRGHLGPTDCSDSDQTKRFEQTSSFSTSDIGETYYWEIFSHDTVTGPFDSLDPDTRLCKINLEIGGYYSGSGEDYDLCSGNLNPGSQAFESCQACFASQGIWTAVGCISNNPRDIIGKLINIGIGIAGGIALLTILSSAFSLTISQGQVQKTTEAKERLTAAIVGLIFIILSVTILEFIGAEVLQIPGFGG